MTKMTSKLAQKVREAIFNHEIFSKNWKIDVMENGGVITLLGTVPTEEDRDLIESIAKEQEGVISVVNELNIRAFTKEALKELESDPEIQIPPTRRNPPDPSQSNY